ncbi:MAG: OmpA family protein [Bacteriovorax sp.]|nr:OmpA family protein [Bacteriovorax sp.]
MKLKSNNLTACFFIFLFFGGCSSGQLNNEIPNIANVAQEFKSLDTDMNTALANQVDVLSPRNFHVANEYLEDARKSLEKQIDPKETLNQIATARTYLNRANGASMLSHRNIEDVVIARQLAVKAGAAGFFASDFQKTDDLLRNITSDLEYNNIVNVERNRKALKTIYLKLELAAIKHQNLAQARSTIAMAIKDGAKKYAPKSLETAINDYQNASVYIDSNRHEVDQIKTRSLAANQSAYQLLQITHESTGPQKKSPERLASMKEDIITTRQSAILKKETRESEKSIDEKLKQARRQFSNNEAEVIKRKNTLIIRLRGLEFPISQAVLKDSNFPILGKVRRVIEEFGRSAVVVEGHTDSSGTVALNEKLSKKRAQTVREYLLSADVIPEKRIKAIGSGEQNPIASNKTPSGRAQNRRVDVMIKF